MVFFGAGIGLVMYGEELRTTAKGQFIGGIWVVLTLLLESWQASCTNDSNQNPCIKKPRFLGVLFLSKRIL
ncbi:MAG: hypothetical protein VX790_05270 [Bacteroidota bacterium]|nr:hypothetical protein [Bacteroidota bacterium]